ncbi:MAG: alkaline phosphatase family protein [Acidimicrobiales bacterium]
MAAVVVVVAGAGTGIGLAVSDGSVPSSDGRRAAPTVPASSIPSASTPTSAAPVTTSTGTTSTGSASTGGPPHVLLVMMENHGYDQIVGSPTAPYLTQLVARYGLATASYAWTHPSLPNYLDIISGSTQGISTDCSSCSADGTQLVDQLQAKGIGWQAFIESMPNPCFTGTGSSPYDKNHNPFAYAPHLVHDAAECSRVVPYARLGPELAAGTAPPFLWVTPNTAHDMHTGTVRQGDTWLSQQVRAVMHSSWYRGGGTIVITFDEGVTNAGCCGGAGGGHIATVVVSAATPHGARMSRPIDHAGVLRTVEELYGLPFLGAAAKASSGTLLPLVGRAPG